MGERGVNFRKLEEAQLSSSKWPSRRQLSDPCSSKRYVSDLERAPDPERKGCWTVDELPGYYGEDEQDSGTEQEDDGESSEGINDVDLSLRGGPPQKTASTMAGDAGRGVSAPSDASHCGEMGTRQVTWDPFEAGQYDEGGQPGTARFGSTGGIMPPAVMAQCAADAMAAAFQLYMSGGLPQPTAPTHAPAPHCFAEARVARKLQEARTSSPAQIWEPGLVTVMIRNIPQHVTQLMMLTELARRGFKGFFDFLYLPLRRGYKSKNVGYCFVNFTGPEHALRCLRQLDGAMLGAGGERPLRVHPASVQGYQANCEVFLSTKTAEKADFQLRPLFLPGGSWAGLLREVTAKLDGLS